MVTRAILANVCQCKPNRRSRGYPDCKQGSKLLKVNYFPSGCIGVGFSTSRCRTRSVTVERAEVSFIVVEIELGAGGHMRRENFGIDGEVEHGAVTPVRGQKRLQLSLPERKISTEISRAASYTCPRSNAVALVRRMKVNLKTKIKYK